MPSVVWIFPAVLLFGLTDAAILLVVVIGAAPSVANGIIHGIDHTPPLLVRAGRVMGARGSRMLGHVLLPAAFPSFVGGLKQGWAFAWRSLLAGEIIVTIGRVQSVGVRLATARDILDNEGIYATMLAILIIGVAIDSLVFANLDKFVRRRWGLLDTAQM